MGERVARDPQGTTLDPYPENLPLNEHQQMRPNCLHSGSSCDCILYSSTTELGIIIGVLAVLVLAVPRSASTSRAMSSARGTRSRSQLASPFNHRASVRSFSSAPRVRRPDQQLELSPKSKNKRSLYDRIKDRVTGREYQRGREANIHREELDAIRQRRLTLSGDYKEAKTWEGLAFEGADRPSRQTRAFTGLYPPARKVTNQAKLEAELYRSVIEIARNQAWLRMRSQQKVAAKEARINRKHQGNLLLEGLQHLFTPTIKTAQNSQASDHSSQSLVEEIASEVPTGALADPEAAVSFDHSIEKAVDDAIKYILTEDVENESDGKRPLESLQILSQHYFRGELPTRRLVDAAKRVRIEAPERFEVRNQHTIN